MKDMDNIQLGKVKVLSHTGTSRSYSIGTITKNYLPEIISTVNLEGFVNNFRGLKSDKFVDPLSAVLNEFALISNNRNEAELSRYSPEKFTELASLIESDESYKKTKVLKELLDSIYWELPTKDFKEIARYANGQMGSKRD
jgi:hypothetical protein